MTDVDVRPGTIVVYSDIGCPWADLAVHRLLRARHALGRGFPIVSADDLSVYDDLLRRTLAAA